MPLDDLGFSDIVLLPDAGSALLKGVAGYDQKMVLAPKDCATEVGALFAKVDGLYKDNGSDYKLAFRVANGNSYYRTALYDEVSAGRTYFLRRIADKVPDLENLGLPSIIANWLMGEEQRQGLFLVAGSQCSGKTTTAAALIKRRLEVFGGHAVTFENPVEMPLSGPHGSNGYCFQSEVRSERELGSHIEGMHRLCSPNILFIGEIRSKYAAAVALQVALGSSQQMVVATIHGLSVMAALDRLTTWAKESDGDVVWQNLSQTFLGIIRQELVMGENGQRELRVPEALLVPFDESKDVSQSVRGKFAAGKLNITDDITTQRNRIAIQNTI